MAMLQSIAHARVSGYNAALCRTNDFFRKSACVPLYHGVEESQGKYSSHQIDAIKGIEAVKAASAESAFRDAMLNEFLSVSQKLFKSTFIVMSWDSVLQSIGLLSTAIFFWVGATASHSRALERWRFCRLQLTDGDGLRGNFACPRRLGQPCNRPPSS